VASNVRAQGRGGSKRVGAARATQQPACARKAQWKREGGLDRKASEGAARNVRVVCVRHCRLHAACAQQPPAGERQRQARGESPGSRTDSGTLPFPAPALVACPSFSLPFSVFHSLCLLLPCPRVRFVAQRLRFAAPSRLCSPTARTQPAAAAATEQRQKTEGKERRLYTGPRSSPTVLLSLRTCRRPADPLRTAALRVSPSRICGPSLGCRLKPRPQQRRDEV
jgi:hypothetical protein